MAGSGVFGYGTTYQPELYADVRQTPEPGDWPGHLEQQARLNMGMPGAALAPAFQGLAGSPVGQTAAGAVGSVGDLFTSNPISNITSNFLGLGGKRKERRRRATDEERDAIWESRRPENLRARADEGPESPRGIGQVDLAGIDPTVFDQGVGFYNPQLLEPIQALLQPFHEGENYLMGYTYDNNPVYRPFNLRDFSHEAPGRMGGIPQGLTGAEMIDRLFSQANLRPEEYASLSSGIAGMGGIEGLQDAFRQAAANVYGSEMAPDPTGRGARNLPEQYRDTAADDPTGYWGRERDRQIQALEQMYENIVASLNTGVL